MRKLLSFLFLFLVAVTPMFAETQTRSATFAAVGSSNIWDLRSTSVGYHQITWHPAAALSQCTVKLWQSTNGGLTYSELIAAQTCTTAGTSTLTTGVADMIYVQVATLAGGSVNVVWDGSSSNTSVSGSVTANAGTNLNTSLLALEAGGNLAAIKAKTDNIPAQGQALAAASMPVVLTASQVSTLTPPAAITGFATSALQGGGLPAALGAGGGVKVDGSGTALPVSLASVPSHDITNAGTFAVQATNAGLDVAQGAAIASKTGPMMQASTTTSAPNYATATVNPLSTDTAGALRTTVTNLTADVAVGGAAGTPVTVAGVDASGNVRYIAAGTAGTPGAAAGVLTVQGITSMTPLSSNLFVGGTTTATGTGDQSVTTARVTVAKDTATIAGSAVGTAGSASTNVVSIQGVGSGTVVPVNVGQINGVTTLMGNGATGTGSQRVTVASDNTPFPIKTDQTTHGTTDKVAADLFMGGTAVSETAPLYVRTVNSLSTYKSAVANGTTDVALVAADANNFTEVGWLSCSNTSATTGTAIKLCDGACSTTNWIMLPCPDPRAATAVSGLVSSLPPGFAFRTAAKNTAVNFVTTGALTTEVTISVLYRKVAN